MFRLLVVIAIVAALGWGFAYLLKAQDQRAANLTKKSGTLEDMLSKENVQPKNDNQETASLPSDKKTAITNAPKRRAKPFSMSIDKNKKYTAILRTTLGDITVNLNAKETPITVNNFVNLAQNNFYNTTIFHRVINGFMIQGGDPKGDGTGDPGYRFDDEPFSGEYTRGTIAMANAGPNTTGSQFFIMHASYPLPKNYVIFGSVVSGLDVVDKIATAPVQSNGSEMSSPVNPVIVTALDIKEE